MYFVLFDLLPAGWLVEASAELLGGLNILAPPPAEVEDLAPLPGVEADLAPLLAAADEVAPLPTAVDEAPPLPAAGAEAAPLPAAPLLAAVVFAPLAAAGEEFVVDDDGAPLALPVADEAAPWCHSGTVLFACNQKIKQLYNDQSIEMNIQVISK